MTTQALSPAPVTTSMDRTSRCMTQQSSKATTMRFCGKSSSSTNGYNKNKSWRIASFGQAATSTMNACAIYNSDVTSSSSVTRDILLLLLLWQNHAAKQLCLHPCCHVYTAPLHCANVFFACCSQYTNHNACKLICGQLSKRVL